MGFTLHEVVKEDEEKGEQRQVKKERKKETRKGRGGGSTIFSFHLMRRLYSLPHKPEIGFMCTYKHSTLEMLDNITKHLE